VKLRGIANYKTWYKKNKFTIQQSFSIADVESLFIARSKESRSPAPLPSEKEKPGKLELIPFLDVSECETFTNDSHP